MSLSKFKWIVVNDEDDVVVVEAETIYDVVESEEVSSQPVSIIRSDLA